ncbi:hypothetical protein NMY22_g10105 [Coprinellus aureogranulatus]|nr:hypothetical protein NMY22_g10105 [Coprinellus aureogranulatus]
MATSKAKAFKVIDVPLAAYSFLSDDSHSLETPFAPGSEGVHMGMTEAPSITALTPRSQMESRYILAGKKSSLIPIPRFSLSPKANTTMSSSSNIACESAHVRVALSPAMFGLLGTLLQAIDRRVDILNKVDEDGYEPETCGTCGGAGYILVAIDDIVDIDEVDQKGKGKATVDAGTSTSSPPTPPSRMNPEKAARP